MIISKNIPVYLIITFIIIALFNGHAMADNTFNCKVIKIYDGDTFTCSNRVKIRVWGIDTPEINSKIPSVKEKAIQARNYLSSYILNQSLQCSKKGKSYNRVVGQCFLKNRDIARPLLEKGLAKEVKQYSKGYYSQYR